MPSTILLLTCLICLVLVSVLLPSLCSAARVMVSLFCSKPSPCSLLTQHKSQRPSCALQGSTGSGFHDLSVLISCCLPLALVQPHWPSHYSSTGMSYPRTLSLPLPSAGNALPRGLPLAHSFMSFHSSLCLATCSKIPVLTPSLTLPIPLPCFIFLRVIIHLTVISLNVCSPHLNVSSRG